MIRFHGIFSNFPFLFFPIGKIHQIHGFFPWNRDFPIVKFIFHVFLSSNPWFFHQIHGIFQWSTAVRSSNVSRRFSPRRGAAPPCWPGDAWAASKPWQRGWRDRGTMEAWRTVTPPPAKQFAMENGYGSWVNTYENSIFSGLFIHFNPAILMWTEGVQGFDTLPVCYGKSLV